MAAVFGQTFSLAALIVLAYMLAVYVVVLVRRDGSIVDVAWGPGVALAVLLTLWLKTSVDWRQMLVALLVVVWGVRLGAHMFLRNWGRNEDFRYAGVREQWGHYAWFGMFVNAVLSRGILMLVVAVPALYVIAHRGPALGWLDWIGVGIWLFGFCWEGIADYQLIRFGKDPANYGHVLSTGLWRYSRHPNHFGEIVMWWGIWLLALSVPGGWLTVVSPLAMTLLLMKISGPLLDAHRMHDPEFRDYVRRTPGLFPWFPRK